jgi:hypothetical protein
LIDEVSPLVGLWDNFGEQSLARFSTFSPHSPTQFANPSFVFVFSLAYTNSTKTPCDQEP